MSGDGGRAAGYRGSNTQHSDQWGGRPGGFGDQPFGPTGRSGAGAGFRRNDGPPAPTAETRVRPGAARKDDATPRADDAATKADGDGSGAPIPPRRERRGRDPFGGRDADFQRRRAAEAGGAGAGDAGRRPGTGARPELRDDRPTPQWGSVARRGAAALQREPHPDGPSASEVWRTTVSRERNTADVWEPEETWVIDEEPRTPSPPPAAARVQEAMVERDQAVGEGSAPGGRRHTVPPPVVAELAAAAGAAKGARLASRLADATHAYDRERYQEARRILRPLADEVPDAAAVRELHGLVLYRLGQWLAATRQLEAYRELSGSHDQHPVLADCYRALHRYVDAEALWDDLRAASPDGDLVAEGRIVAAGCRADQGDLDGAITLLEKALKRVEHPKDRHLRQWYALADLYERAGDIPRAREMFGRIARTQPDAFDVRERLRAVR